MGIINYLPEDPLLLYVTRTTNVYSNREGRVINSYFSKASAGFPHLPNWNLLNAMYVRAKHSMNGVYSKSNTLEKRPPSLKSLISRGKGSGMASLYTSATETVRKWYINSSLDKK